MRQAIAIAGALAALGMSACGGGDTGATTRSDGRAHESANATDAGGGGGTEAGGSNGAAKSGVEITTADSQFGTILFDGDDRAIYLFQKEQGSKSECYGECAAAWPPVLTDGGPGASEGADAGLLGTTRRDDGATQVTYAGHPLYYYVDDPPGQVLCHNVVEFGGLWLVVQPSGEAVS